MAAGVVAAADVVAVQVAWIGQLLWAVDCHHRVLLLLRVVLVCVFWSRLLSALDLRRRVSELLCLLLLKRQGRLGRRRQVVVQLNEDVFVVNETGVVCVVAAGAVVVVRGRLVVDRLVEVFRRHISSGTQQVFFFRLLQRQLHRVLFRRWNA